MVWWLAVTLGALVALAGPAGAEGAPSPTPDHVDDSDLPPHPTTPDTDTAAPQPDHVDDTDLPPHPTAPEPDQVDDSDLPPHPVPGGAGSDVEAAESPGVGQGQAGAGSPSTEPTAVAGAAVERATDELPRTGRHDGLLAMAGTALILGGMAARRVARGAEQPQAKGRPARA